MRRNTYNMISRGCPPIVQCPCLRAPMCSGCFHVVWLISMWWQWKSTKSSRLFDLLQLVQRSFLRALAGARRALEELVDDAGRVAGRLTVLLGAVDTQHRADVGHVKEMPVTWCVVSAPAARGPLRYYSQSHFVYKTLYLKLGRPTGCTVSGVRENKSLRV